MKWGDLKLQILDRLDRCVEEKVASRGPVDIALSFEIVENKPTVTSVEIEESELTVDEDGIVSGCLAVLARELVLEDPGEGRPLTVHTRIRFPLAEDRIYKLIEANGNLAD